MEARFNPLLGVAASWQLTQYVLTTARTEAGSAPKVTLVSAKAETAERIRLIWLRIME